MRVSAELSSMRRASSADGRSAPGTAFDLPLEWSRACTSFHKGRRFFMSEPLRNKRIAALVDDGFEESELIEPKRALEAAGAKVDIVSSQTFRVTGWQDGDWSQGVNVEYHLDT